jgi:hypothetical protein
LRLVPFIVGQNVADLPHPFPQRLMVPQGPSHALFSRLVAALDRFGLDHRVEQFLFQSGMLLKVPENPTGEKVPVVSSGGLKSLVQAPGLFVIPPERGQRIFSDVRPSFARLLRCHGAV